MSSHSPPADAAPYPHRWKALGVLSLSLLVISLDNTILNVALPTIREDLDATSSQLQWIVDSYMLVFAGLLLTAGTLGDRFGRKRALFAGMSIFGLGSILGALSDGSTELILSRALMGVGAAGIMPTTLSILTNIFPSHERPKAIAIWAATSGMGIAIGPLTGGFLIEHFAWTSVFLVNVPFVALALLGGWKLIPDSRDPAKPPIDFVGAALSIFSLTTIVWGLIEAPEKGWTSPTIAAAFAIGQAGLALFIAWERRCKHPMLDLSVFRNLRFSAANLAVTFVFFALMGVIYFLTTYLQDVMGYTALQAGVRMLPIAAGLLLTTKLSVILSERFGAKLCVAAGLGTVAASLTVFASATVETGYDRVGVALFLMGAGMALAMSPATEAIMGALPKAKAGIGSAMNDVVREVGGTLGVAVLGSVLASRFASGMDDAVSALPAEQAEAASDTVGSAHAVATQIGGEAGAKLAGLADEAFVTAMTTTATVAAAVALAGALIALAFLPARARAAQEREPGLLPEPTAA